MPPIFSKKEASLFAVNNSKLGQKRTSPCEVDCPLNNAIQKIQEAVIEKNFDLALQTLHAKSPFPGVTSRTCPHACEINCNRGCLDEPVSIKGVERFVADNGQYKAFIPLEESKKSVAIVGSGPAGMASAYFLALLGHSVTIFESSPVMGGVPRHSIPDFRLPKSVVEKEIGQILQFNVEVHTNTTIGKDISLSELMNRYDACLLAVGNTIERTLPIAGKEYMSYALAFLQSANLNRARLENRKVAVLGGGGVAFDCAFTAARLGAQSVHIICLEGKDCMCAPTEEVLQAYDEGISIHNNKLAKEIVVENDEIKGIKFESVQSFCFSKEGQLEAEILPDSHTLLDVDMVICASGLMVDLSFAKDLQELETKSRGYAEVDSITNATSYKGLFAAGECTIGPSSVAASVADGRKAALGIHAYLSNLDMAIPYDLYFDSAHMPVVTQGKLSAQHTVNFDEIVNLEYHKEGKRNEEQILKAEKTWFAFEELNKGFDIDAVINEAERCLRCGQCRNCGECVEACPGLILKKTDNGPQVEYPDECWHCGCCRLACPGGCIEFKFPLHTML